MLLQKAGRAEVFIRADMIDIGPKGTGGGRDILTRQIGAPLYKWRSETEVETEEGGGLSGLCKNPVRHLLTRPYFAGRGDDFGRGAP